MTHKVLVDCTFCENDRRAIRRLLCEPETMLTAVTVVFGEEAPQLSLEKMKEAALSCGISAPIAIGAGKPILETNTSVSRKTKKAESEMPQPPYAWDIIYEEALKSQGKLTVITLGPLTNLAIALFKYEKLSSYINKIVMLGGSSEAGNLTPFGEANVVRDVYACKAVFQSKIPIWMMGLDVAEREGMEFDGCLAVAAALWPELFRAKEYHVTVDTALGEMYGRTVPDKRLHSQVIPNVHVVEEVDKEQYQRLIQCTLVSEKDKVDK